MSPVCVSGIKWIGWVFLPVAAAVSGNLSCRICSQTPWWKCAPAAAASPTIFFFCKFIFFLCVENKVFLRFTFYSKRGFSILLQRALPKYFKHVREVTHSHTLTCIWQFPCIYYENTLKVNFLNALVAFSSLSAWRFTVFMCFPFSRFFFLLLIPFSRGDCRVQQPLWPVC